MDKPFVGKRALEPPPGQEASRFQFLEFVDFLGRKTSLHGGFAGSDHFFLTTVNPAGDYRSARLDLDQVRAIHEATGLILADREALSTTTDKAS